MIPGTWPVVEWRLDPADIHLWLFSMDVSPADLKACKKILSPSELDRAQEFRFQKDRNQFITSHGLKRILLSRYLQVSPADLEFARSALGKPSLSGTFAQSRLHFNLAHSGNLVLIAVTRIGMIGVDIERIRPLDDLDELVARFFSTREKAAFQKLPKKQRPAAFFRLWTRKESWLKATGEGISKLGQEPEVSSLAAGRQDGASWIVQDLKSSRGFAAALTVSASCTALLRCYWWKEKNGHWLINI